MCRFRNPAANISFGALWLFSLTLPLVNYIRDLIPWCGPAKKVTRIQSDNSLLTDSTYSVINDECLTSSSGCDIILTPRPVNSERKIGSKSYTGKKHSSAIELGAVLQRDKKTYRLKRSYKYKERVTWTSGDSKTETTPLLDNNEMPKLPKVKSKLATEKHKKDKDNFLQVAMCNIDCWDNSAHEKRVCFSPKSEEFYYEADKRMPTVSPINRSSFIPYQAPNFNADGIDIGCLNMRNGEGENLSLEGNGMYNTESPGKNSTVMPNVRGRTPDQIPVERGMVYEAREMNDNGGQYYSSPRYMHGTNYNTSTQRPYDEAPRPYDEAPRTYAEKLRSYDMSPRPYNEAQRPYGEDSRSYAESPRPYYHDTVPSSGQHYQYNDRDRSFDKQNQHARFAGPRNVGPSTRLYDDPRSDFQNLQCSYNEQRSEIQSYRCEYVPILPHHEQNVRYHRNETVEGVRNSRPFIHVSPAEANGQGVHNSRPFTHVTPKEASGKNVYNSRPFIQVTPREASDNGVQNSRPFIHVTPNEASGKNVYNSRPFIHVSPAETSGNGVHNSRPLIHVTPREARGNGVHNSRPFIHATPREASGNGLPISRMDEPRSQIHEAPAYYHSRINSDKYEFRRY